MQALVQLSTGTVLATSQSVPAKVGGTWNDDLQAGKNAWLSFADGDDVSWYDFQPTPTPQLVLNAARKAAAAAAATTRSNRVARLQTFTASTSFANLTAAQQQVLQDLVDHLLGK